MALTVVDRPSLAERTSLKLGGHGIAEVTVRSEGDLDGLSDALARLGGTPLALGYGSNLLARDGDLPVVLVRTAPPGALGRGGSGESGGAGTIRVDGATVRVSAGLPLPVLLARLRTHGLSGLEGLAGIPGSVGGAVAMNAGSYGVEFTGLMRRVRIWTVATGLVWLERGSWEAGYRHFRPLVHQEPSGAEPVGPETGRPETAGSPCPGGLDWLVWECELELTPARPEQIAAAMAAHFDRKRATQPLAAASAGCVFRNPMSPSGPAGPSVESAGRLLDQAGLRGVRLGGMGFSELHANFLVNVGGGRSDEAQELIDMARERVRKMFGLELSLEVRVVPCP